MDEYQPFSTEPVLPAFEIIATVAAQSPGPDGNFTNEWPAEEFVPLVDAPSMTVSMAWLRRTGHAAREAFARHALAVLSAAD